MGNIGILVCALVFSLAAHAQPATSPRVGVLLNGTTATNGHFHDAFRRGLAEHGYVEGRNIVLDARYADGVLSRLPDLARELAALKPNVLFTPSALGSHALKNAAGGLPIVFALTPDPVAEGFVANLARPGGNMTGLTSLSPEMSAKRTQLLREALPGLSRLAVLHSARFPGVPAQLAEAERAVKLAGKEMLGMDVTRMDQLDAAFSEMVARRADALLVIENPMFFLNRTSIIALAAKHRLPAMYIAKEYVLSGGLMSYGSNYTDLVRRAAGHVHRILKGANPGDLPVEQPVKFELVINLATAKALGLAIAPALLVRADQVLD